MNPWDYWPMFTQDRLVAVGDILRRSRDSAARNAKRKLGDSLCSIGLVAFDRSCTGLTRAAAQEYREWLSIDPHDNHFIIKICGVPARFYRGDAEMPIPAKTLDLGPGEKIQTELALQSTGLAGLVQCVRFEVEKTYKGFTESVNFVLVKHDDTRLLSWPIPRYVAQRGEAPTRRGAVKLPPVSLDPPTIHRADEGTV
jgi:hypothetical protein